MFPSWSPLLSEQGQRRISDYEFSDFDIGAKTSVSDKAVYSQPLLYGIRSISLLWQVLRRHILDSQIAVDDAVGL